MDTLEIFYRGGVALFIGLLMGIQREHAHEDEPGQISFGGVRTFTLIALLGFLSAMLGEAFGLPALFPVVLALVGLFVATSYVFSAREGQVGMTTEMAGLVAALIGASCYVLRIEVGVALGVVTTALLALKVHTRRFVRKLSRADVYATIKFAIITAIILPVLPDQPVGAAPLDVLNPYNVWLMVVLISGISFLGYVLIKVVGTRRGVGLTGLLGGLASSTAVTLSFAQRSRSAAELSRAFAVAILLAWAVMFVRVLIEVAVVNRALLASVWLPVTGTGLVTIGYCIYLYVTGKTDKQEQPDRFANPFELGPALTFGLLYGVVLVVARAAQLYFGDTGLFLSSIVSGLADVDAITLSVAELSLDPERLSHASAATAIVLAVLSNTVVKAGIVAATGVAPLRRAILPGLGLILATGLGLIALI